MTYIGEAVSIILSGYFANSYGRINTMKLFAIIAAIKFIIFEIFGILNIGLFSPIFVFLISFSISAFYNVLSISTMEYFPTVIRGSCVGLTNIVGKAATTIVPSMTTFVSHSPFLFSFFLILSVLMMNHLEETKGKEIQDLVPELEKAQNNFDEPKYRKNLFASSDDLREKYDILINEKAHDKIKRQLKLT